MLSSKMLYRLKKSGDWYFQIFPLLILTILVPYGTVWSAVQANFVHNTLPDFDSRADVLAPTGQQTGIVSSLGATARWNKFGTPKSLIKYGGYLATGLSGDPVTAAKNWIRTNKALFRLTNTGVNSLELVSDSLMAGYDGHAIIFRQKFGTLPAGVDGLITVGISGGKIAYVSSSSAGDQSSPGSASLDPVIAWFNAATSIGQSISLSGISPTRKENSWTVFDVPGFSHPQRSRLVAFPRPGQSARPAFETNVLNVRDGAALAYTFFVDAQTGEILMRTNRVQQQATGDAPQISVFNGDYSLNPAVCGPCHTYTVPDGTASITVTASAIVPSNDIVLNLYQGNCATGTLLSSIDTATSPEAVLAYTVTPPTSGGAQYSAEVCPFVGSVAPQSPPFTYAGAFTTSPATTDTFFFPPKWDFFTANPRLDLASTDTRITGCWATSGSDINKDVSDCSVELQNLASRVPWDHSVQGNAPTNTTIGNNAITAQAWTSPLTPGEGYRPVSPTRDYQFVWENKWQTQKCSQTALLPPNGNDIDAATANLFVKHNRMHDWSYFLGFTERNFNMQTNNFGLTAPGPFPLGGENDPEIGDVQAGALTGGYPSLLGRDNANQITLQDGIPPITNMYLWQPLAAAFYAPCVDGDYDMSVIGHEYTHAISNRMVGGPNSGLTGQQSGAMGESWSDLSAVEILNEFNDYVPGGSVEFPTSNENAFAVGPYVTGNKERGIRNYNMSRNVAVAGFSGGPPQVLAPTSPLTNKNPLNYSNVGYDFVCTQDDLGACISLSQVHADGEIWSAVNYDIRQLLITKYNGSFPSTNKALQRDCANGELPANQCPGNRRWIQIMFDAFLLMQSDVDMVDARNAYLGADLLRFAGANQTELWRAFARRGLGQNASTVNAEDVDPVASFESPNEGEIGFQFKILDADGVTPIIGAKVFVGHYEARTTPIAVSGAGGITPPAQFVTGYFYDFLVQANGYGHIRFPRNAWAGGINNTYTLTVRMAKNVASIHNGAVGSGDGAATIDNLLDDTEATVWESTSGDVPDDAVGDQVTIALAGGEQNIKRVQVSAMLDPVQGGRFTALRQFEVWTCTAGANVLNPTCSGILPAGFTLRYTSPADAFPGTAPRPTAPDLILREFDIPDSTATHVQFKVRNNQCTGQTKFQGEQDLDNSFSTDCRVGDEPAGLFLPPADLDIRAAEFQVFATSATAPPMDPIVVVNMTAPATAARGANVEYSLTYHNAGPFASSNAKITDQLPPQVDFVSATGGGVYNATTRTVTWNLGTVNVGFTGTKKVTTRIKTTTAPGTAITNRADYSADLTVATPASAVTVVLP